MDTKARHIVKNLYKFYKCHHNCLKLLKSRFVHNMNPSFRAVWVCNLTNGIPGNSTDVQLAYGGTEHTDHIQDLLVSQHKERSHLETEIQQISVKHRGGFVTAVPAAPPAEGWAQGQKEPTELVVPQPFWFGVSSTGNLTKLPALSARGQSS